MNEYKTQMYGCSLEAKHTQAVLISLTKTTTKNNRQRTFFLWLRRDVSRVPKFRVRTSKSTDLEGHASEVHKGPSEVHEMLRLRRIS